jgi:aspartyl-tRNA(Asn)/glutamyl-tRNA(Gln) amidotransferase subunit A
MTDDLPLTIAEAAQRIKTRELSPVELVSGLLERITNAEPAIHAFITLTAEQAVAQAIVAEDEIARGHYRGPLHGIPIGLKDIYQTAGIRTSGHSRVFMDYVPDEDAAAWTKLREAGAILMGKLATHELAHGGPSFDLPWPPARNPWNPAHFTGGSSSGSAAAVAAGFVLGAMGSDTGGSIRTPASLCGISGIKPTFGLVSRHGVIPNSFSLDHCGPMACTAEDCAIMLDVVAGHDDRDRSSARGPRRSYRAGLRTNLRGVRIGVVRHFWENDCPANTELIAATEQAIRVLQGLGAEVSEIRLRPVRDFYDVWNMIEAPETFSIHRKALTEQPHDFGSVFLERTLLACLIESSDYVRAQQARGRIVDEMQPFWRTCDALLTAGAGPAPVLTANMAQWPAPNVFSPFALVGAPAVVCNAGFSERGLPMSIQLAGKPFEDAALLGIAHAYEMAAGWWRYKAAVAPDARPEPVVHEPRVIDTATLDPKIVSLCSAEITRAGIPISDAQLAILCSKAPHMIEMIERVRTNFDSRVDPAGIFVLPSGGS